MDQQTLIDLANTVATRMQTEYIYQLLYTDGDMEKTRMVVLVAENSEMKFSQIDALLKPIMADISYSLFKVNDMKDALSNGNLFFHNVCQDENLLFKNSKSRTLPHFSFEKLINWKTIAQERFEKSMEKACLFADGVNFYKERETDLTAFMLHQTAELTYRALELNLIGKEKKSHSIKHHQSYLLYHVPQLGKQFPVETEDDLKLLKNFEKAYTDSRYRENFHFPAEHIELMQHRVVNLQHQGKMVFDQMVNIFEKKAHNLSSLQTLVQDHPDSEKRMQTRQIEEASSPHLFVHRGLQPEITNVVTLLIERSVPDQMYVFGGTSCDLVQGNLFCTAEAGHKKSFHYDILVLTTQERPYSNNLQNLINSDPENNLTVTLFFHPLEEALDKLAEGSRFFTTIFRHGKLVYSRVPVINQSEVPTIDLMKVVPSALTTWQRRSKRASLLLRIAKLAMKEDPGIAAAIAAQTIQQKLLAIIYLLSGYTPNHNTHAHLISICIMLWPDAENYLGRTNQGRAALSLLARSQSDLLYRTRSDISESTMTAILSFCSNFLEAADKVCLKEIESVQKEMKLVCKQIPEQL